MTADDDPAVFSRRGTLRRKLVLLLAILESTGETSELVDTPDRGSVAGFLAGTALRAIGFVLTVAVAAVWLGPRHVAAGLGRGDEEAPA